MVFLYLHYFISIFFISTFPYICICICVYFPFTYNLFFRKKTILIWPEGGKCKYLSTNSRGSGWNSLHEPGESWEQTESSYKQCPLSSYIGNKTVH